MDNYEERIKHYIYICILLGYLYAVIRINVVELFLLTPVEIGPSNASPG